MEVHKPKAWHGVRDFLKEYAIIVVGVLTALVAEQVAQAVHDREVVRSGEEALHENFARFVQYSTELDQENACMAARVAELRAILDQAAVTHRLPAIAHIPQPYPRPWEIDTWQAMVAAQAAPHLARDRIVLYSRIARSGDDIYDAQQQRTGNWAALQGLAGAARPFSEAEQAPARAALYQGFGWASRMQFIAHRTVQRISGTGLIDAAAMAAAAERGRHLDHPMEMCDPISAAPER